MSLRSGWTSTFIDPGLIAAIVNRLTFGGNIIETGTTSYRVANTPSSSAADGTARPLSGDPSRRILGSSKAVLFSLC